MICQAQRTKEREKQYLFSDYAIGAETSVLYVSKENDIYYYNDYAAYNLAARRLCLGTASRIRNSGTMPPKRVFLRGEHL